MYRCRRILKLAVSAILLASLFATPTASGAPTLSGQQALLLDQISANETRISNLQQTSKAVEARLSASRTELATLRSSLNIAEQAVDSQQSTFNQRLVDIYKSGSGFQIALLSNSRDLNDLLTRMRLLSTIADADQRTLTNLKTQKLGVAQAKQRMEQIESEQSEMLAFQESQLAELEKEVARERKLLARVSAKIKAIIAARRRAAELAAKAAARRSKPLGGAIAGIYVTVDKYPGQRFLTAYDNPKAYRATGVRQSGTSSWYGGNDGFNGQATASGEIFNDNDFTAAHRTLPLGTYLAVWHQGRAVIVRINDRGPFISGRILDLSKRAAEELGIGGLGQVQTEVVSPK